MGDRDVSEWTLDGVLDEMGSIHGAMKDRQFAFILGAGASFTSGIPTGQHLAQKWLKDLHLRECADGRSLDQWIAECWVGDGALTMQTAAERYPQIFERRFDGDREAGYAELEAAMEGKSPSLGYSLLAEIIQHTRHKVVVTTNFDNLVADALAMHAHQSPLIVAHESLAGFVRPQLRRPLVAKIHRDLYLHPINDAAGVSTMELAWKMALKKLFQYFTPVVVGYGGNDGSLMDMLLGLDEGDIAGRMIWCYREDSPVPEKALKVLRKHSGLLVKIAGFDEFMLQLAAKLVTDFDVAAIADRTAKLGQERADRYRDQASKLRESSERGSLAEQRAGAVLTQSVRLGQSWWAWQMTAMAQPNVEERRRIYLEGLRHLPASPELTGSYANFLVSLGKDKDEAEVMYKKALGLDPSNASITGNYATFLSDQRDLYDEAEAMYKKALVLDPSNANNIGNYAIFLTHRREDYDAAELMFKQALELSPNHVNNLGNYGRFLLVRHKDYDAAEAMYKKALELNPNHPYITSSYAEFLAEYRGDYDAADALYKKALDLAPTNANIVGNYAIFLANQGKNLDAAEAMHKKALDIDADHANNTGSYAYFLSERRKDDDGAEAMYKRSLELDPRNAKVRGNYANFLATNRKHYDEAEKMYRKVLDLAPNNVNSAGNYAHFLSNIGKDFDTAEAMFKKALALDSNDANVTSNYAYFLSERRKDDHAAQAMYKKAIELDPSNANYLANLVFSTLVASDVKSARTVLPLVYRVIDLCRPTVSQALAEALLYGALVEELVPGESANNLLNRLKAAMAAGFERAQWDFSRLLNLILPKLDPSRRELFRAVGDAILDAEKVADLEKIETWRALEAVDPYLPLGGREHM